MNLTAKQEAFCKEYVKRCTDDTDRAIYSKVYDVENMSDNAISVEVSRLLDNPKISLKIDQLRKPIEKAFNKSVEDILNEIDNLKDNNLDKNDKLVLDCLKEQGKLLGYYVEKKEVKNDGNVTIITRGKFEDE